MLCGRASKIPRCDKGILRSGRNISSMCRCSILEGKIICFAFVDHNIDCYWLLSLAVRYIITYRKLLRKIVEVTCCHIKIKRNLMVALLLILRDCRVAAKNMLFKHFLRSDRPLLSCECTRNQLSNVPSEIFNLKRNRPRNLHEQICNFRE